jgi:hypothetical protein
VNRRFHHTAAIAAFELRQRIGSPTLLIGAAAYAALLALGHWLYWNAPPPRPDDDRLFGYAYITAMFVSLRFGIAADTTSGFRDLLAGNLTTPRRYIAGKVQATVTFLLAFAPYAFVLALAFSAGDWRYALWYPTLFTLVAALFLPAVFAAELALRIHYPVAVVIILFFTILAALEPFYGIEAVVRFLGLRTERFAPESLLPLAGRVAIAGILLALLAELASRSPRAAPPTAPRRR